MTVLSIALMVVDARFEALKPLRSHLGMLLTPLYYVADLPVRAWDTLYLQLTSRADLIAENERLRAMARDRKRTRLNPTHQT